MQSLKEMITELKDGKEPLVIFEPSALTPPRFDALIRVAKNDSADAHDDLWKAVWLIAYCMLVRQPARLVHAAGEGALGKAFSVLKAAAFERLPPRLMGWRISPVRVMKS